MGTSIDILLSERKGSQPCIEAKAFSKKTALVSIQADTIQDAFDLIEEGKAEALKAIDAWTPEEHPRKKLEEHYAICEKSIEKMAAEAASYEDSAEGKRFVKSIKNAAEFMLKHGHGGLLVSQLNYLANKHQNNFINGSWDCYCLAYRRGYNEGKKAAK